MQNFCRDLQRSVPKDVLCPANSWLRLKVARDFTTVETW